VARRGRRGYTAAVSALLSMLLALAVPAPALAAVPATFEALEGDWLHPEYLAALRRTRSNVKAYAEAKDAHPVQLRFAQGKDGRSFAAVTIGFHEGDPQPCDGLALEPAQDGSAVSRCGNAGGRGTFRLVDGDLEWHGTRSDDARGVRYVRVRGSVASFAAAAALAGGYRDEKGGSVELRKDGTARWEGREHGYSIELDAVYWPDVLNMSKEKGRGESWIYKLTKDGLELWTMREDENGFQQPDRLAHTLVRR
jgi:hypothetical protein